jgi:long-chain acyl-CoA synthetase
MSAPVAPGLISGERYLPYDRMRAAAMRAASGFTQLGVGRGDAVALLMRNDFPYIEATMAAALVGAYAVPLNWHGSAEEIAYLLDHSEARALVVHADLLEPIRDAIPAHTRVLVVQTPPEVAAAYSIAPDAGQVCAADTEWSAWRDAQDQLTMLDLPKPDSVIYTSGTTGRPKGVKRTPMTPEQLVGVAQVALKMVGIRPDSRVLIPAPLYHSSPNGAAMIAAQMGATLVLSPRFEPEALLVDIERHGITTLVAVPTMFVKLLKLDPAVRARYDVSSLEHVSHTAAPCPAAVKHQMIEWWGPVITEVYGSTELGVVALCTSEDWLKHPGTVGRVLENAVVKILDDSRAEVPANTVGEVFGRLLVMSDFTYDKDDEERRAIDVDGLITCGDLGYLDDDGFLYLCDRKRDMVILGGSNVYPAEIEAVLLEMPDVADCAVFGIPHDELGETLAAAVQTRPGRLVTAEEIQAHLSERIASYKVPRTIDLHDELPREDSGKIMKNKLREPYWRGLERRI